MRKNTFILIIVIGIFISLSTIQIGETTPRIEYKQITENATLALVPHGPIEITYDDDFIDYGFPGNGTAKDPYLIEKYNITGSIDNGILISHTTKSFVIRNCYVDVDQRAITIEHVVEGSNAIKDNICSNTHGGINLYFSSGVIVSNNTCYNNIRGGIFLSMSSGITVSNNTCINNFDYGIGITMSSGVTVSNNICNNNTNEGIWFYDSTGMIAENNICNDNNIGIKFTLTFDSNLINNGCKNNSTGIYLSYSNSCLITYNLLQENGGYGVSLDTDSENNIIHHNQFIDNMLGGTSQAFDDGVNNTWYDSQLEEGNYWNDWNSKEPYTISGNATSTDLYPLNEKLERIKFEFILCMLSIIFFALLYRSICTKKRKLIKK